MLLTSDAVNGIRPSRPLWTISRTESGFLTATDAKYWRAETTGFGRRSSRDGSPAETPELDDSHAVTLSLAFAGCTSPNPKIAFDDVDRHIVSRSGQEVRWMRNEAAQKEIEQAVEESVITPNGLTLPWKMVNGEKVNRLVVDKRRHQSATSGKAGGLE